ncbi:RDD family protein [Allosalinactinospora lopnorensis]|uniref:RDD family protein n=1 Tax=Allosalinactinospora lopnorensis TaxID=1352348 RepID=UPI0006992012|nr:RDD family protein [Allosalinactinospora lopnorensis]
MVDGKPLAEWWQRLVARIIDSLVVILPVFLVYMIVFSAMVTGATGPVVLGGGTHFGADLFAGLLVLGLLVGYETFMLHNYGRTVGKMTMGVRVLPLAEAPQPNGGLSVNTSVVRGLMWWGPTALGNMIPFIGQLIHLFPLLNGLWPLWDQPSRQSLNDKVANTVVVVDR